MKTIIIFNAPPQSGKDEAALHLCSTGYHPILEFKQPLVATTLAFYGIDLSTWDKWYVAGEKEKPREELGGLSCREALINMSENALKPVFGKDVMGKRMVGQIKSLPTESSQYVFIPDSGFDEEVLPVMEAYGRENLYLIKIKRDGCSYNGDSRKDLSEDMFKRVYTIENNGTLDELHTKAEEVFTDIRSKKDAYVNNP